jgi:hypothetical protein
VTGRAPVVPRDEYYPAPGATGERFDIALNSLGPGRSVPDIDRIDAWDRDTGSQILEEWAIWRSVRGDGEGRVGGLPIQLLESGRSTPTPSSTATL